MGGRLYRVNVWANSACWVGRGCGPLEWVGLCEKARLEPLAYIQAYRGFWSANWQLCRIDCILSWARTAAVACAHHSSKNHRQTRQTCQDFSANCSHLHPPQATPSSLRRSTQPHRSPLFFQRATMLAAKRRNRHSWFSSRAKKTPEMDNEQATFWLSQFIGKNLRIHASDGRVFGGQMKCTDKVGSSHWL